ncbi:MAG: hypothetical protein JJU05_12430 [Verrucomicrobia bacterium]|nr:hypothetical protein [Verrucomicrobiota bacterium]MCH8528347.1 hypothetical protein [Kiritimatiellia bacterium]
MFKDVAKQMIPFFILLGVLWVTAEILERSLGPGHTIIAPPGYEAPARSAPAGEGR